ncbi:hypothetical protein [Streptomyces sp. CB00455]|uniref:hypothetical protein n=1 Tax=Streptomyces sp. CB00455 TaxID=1703927 RepID=UPI001300ECE6
MRVKPAGMFTPGQPGTFHVQAYGHAAIIARSVAIAPRHARAPSTTEWTSGSRDSAVP